MCQVTNPHNNCCMPYVCIPSVCLSIYTQRVTLLARTKEGRASREPRLDRTDPIRSDLAQVAPAEEKRQKKGDHFNPRPFHPFTS